MRVHCAISVVLLLGNACTRGESAQRTNEKTAAVPPATKLATADGPRGVLPNDMCELIPVADVESVLGKLIGPPTGSETTCKYPLPLDDATAKDRADYQKMARDLAGPKSPAARDTTLSSNVVVVSIDLRGDMSGERGARMAGAMLTKMSAAALGKDATPDTTKQEPEPKRPEGWDRASTIRGKSDFSGRIGHLVVSVDENADLVKAVPSEKKAALAALVRDRVTDLPFAYPFAGRGPSTPPSGPDPCSLVTREEAESVLGKLLAPPYRSHDGGPYAKPNGDSCGYYTAGHHVLVLTPRWQRGKQLFEIGGGISKLVTSVAGDPDREKADTLDGPWDNVQLGLDGTLEFLAGDPLLTVEYLTSSTDPAGAVRLARVALKRLTSKS